eukprot:jgi/Psemu1/10991/gm1.10991_g
MTPTTNSARKRGANPHSNGDRNNEKKGRLKDPSPNNPLKDDDNQQKHRRSVEDNLKLALRNQSYATDEFVRALSLEVTTCFTALTAKVYLVSRIIESKPRPNFRKTMSTMSTSKKKKRGKKKKFNTPFSALGPIPRQIDVMVNFFLYEVDNGVTGELELLTRKQKSERLKDYNMNNKWVNFESLLRDVHNEIGGGDTTSSLYGRNVVNYATIKKYMIMYREILVWYMENVQYPPGPDNTSKGLWFHTKCQNGSPAHDSKQYVHAMKNFLDGLMAKSSLPISLSHSYNQVDLDKHFKLQRDTNIPKTGQVLLPLHSPLVFHYVLNYKDTVSDYYNSHFEFDKKLCNTITMQTWHRKDRSGTFHRYQRNHLFVLKVNDNGCFGYEHVMETIEDLVLTKRSFLGGAVFPKLSDEDLAYYQRNDHLYIYPLAVDLSKTQFAHDNFEDTPEPLVTGILELSGLKAKHNNQTCGTQFLQYDVNSQQEVDRRIFMEHIPYVFREIFLPARNGYKLEKSDNLSSSNLLVQFLDNNVGSDFVFHQLSDFETWDSFKTSKDHLQNKGGNKPPGNNSNEAGSDGDNVTKTNQHKGNNNERGSLDTGESLKPKANESKKSGNGAKAKGDKELIAVPVAVAGNGVTTKGNSKEAGTGEGDNVTKTNQHSKGKNNDRGSPDTGNSLKQKANESKKSGNGAKAKGDKESLTLPVAAATPTNVNGGKAVPSPHAHMVSKVMESAAAVSARAKNASTAAPSLAERSEMGEKDGTNEWEEEVPHWKHNMNVTVTVSKFPMRVGRP